MELETGYLLYLLAVVAAGIVSIVLGYRLFLKGVGGEAGGSATSAEAKTRIFRFSIKERGASNLLCVVRRGADRRHGGRGRTVAFGPVERWW
jgi:hypothetical protein